MVVMKDVVCLCKRETYATRLESRQQNTDLRVGAKPLWLSA